MAFYLFLSLLMKVCCALQPIASSDSPLIRVIQGKLASEVHVMFPIVQHVLRISDSTGNRLLIEC